MGSFRKCTEMIKRSRTGRKTSIFISEVDTFFSAFSIKTLIRIIIKFLPVKIFKV